MQNKKMEIYDAVRRPPEEALKQIKGGRMNGKTNIDPMWRIEKMTEIFGPCGIGWWTEIVKMWSEERSGEVTSHMQINLFIRVDGDISHPIPGIGGSKQVTQERNGYHISDECYKMAYTDALSVAMKSLGVAADVYMGMFDGSKYKDEAKKEKKNRLEKELLDVKNRIIKGLNALEDISPNWEKSLAAQNAFEHLGCDLSKCSDLKKLGDYLEYIRKEYLEIRKELES